MSPRPVCMPGAKYEGMAKQDAKELKSLKGENARLKRHLAEVEREKQPWSSLRDEIILG